MESQLRWRLVRLTRRLWFRATLISLLAVAAALVSLVVSPYLPEGLSAKIGAEAVDKILSIIASSMLAVTTFSLSTMVSAYSAATSNVTPRATTLLIEDATTQNVLAVFVGSFLFSLVGIVTLAMGAYGERGRIVLFVMTILVILLIVITLLRWIDYVIRLGRVGDTTEEVEAATLAAIHLRLRRPYLGGVPLLDPSKDIPKSATPVFPEVIGYVQHLDMAILSDAVSGSKARIYVVALPGTFVDQGRPFAWIDAAPDEETADAVRRAYTVGEVRTYDQDPRFGLCVMAEVASRALSPGINDPGTAIDVIGRAVRVLAEWSREGKTQEPEFESVYVPALSDADLFDDIFEPIARDGAALTEIQIRLHKGLASLARVGSPEYRRLAIEHSRLALQRAEAAMTFERDKERVRRAAERVGGDALAG